MPSTTSKGLRYPLAGDNPAVHTDIFNLATDVDTYLDAPQVTTSIVFEGATADAYETTLTVVDPTADRTLTLPNVSGTIITTGDTGTVTNTMLASTYATDISVLDRARQTAFMLGGM